MKKKHSSSPQSIIWKKTIIITAIAIALALPASATPPFHIAQITNSDSGITYQMAALPPATNNFVTVNGVNYFPDTAVFLHAGTNDTAWTAFKTVPIQAASIGGSNPIMSERFVQAWSSSQYFTVTFSNSVVQTNSDYYPPLLNAVGPAPTSSHLNPPAFWWLFLPTNP